MREPRSEYFKADHDSGGRPNAETSSNVATISSREIRLSRCWKIMDARLDRPPPEEAASASSAAIFSQLVEFIVATTRVGRGVAAARATEARFFSKRAFSFSMVAIVCR